MSFFDQRLREEIDAHTTSSQIEGGPAYQRSPKTRPRDSVDGMSPEELKLDIAEATDSTLESLRAALGTKREGSGKEVEGREEGGDGVGDEDDSSGSEESEDDDDDDEEEEVSVRQQVGSPEQPDTPSQSAPESQGASGQQEVVGGDVVPPSPVSSDEENEGLGYADDAGEDGTAIPVAAHPDLPEESW